MLIADNEGGYSFFFFNIESLQQGKQKKVEHISLKGLPDAHRRAYSVPEISIRLSGQGSCCPPCPSIHIIDHAHETPDCRTRKSTPRRR